MALVAVMLLIPAFAAPDTATLQNVLSSVTFYPTEAGRPARAVLVQGKAVADLYIFLSGANDEMNLTLTKPGVAFSGVMDGNIASLGVAANNSLLIKSENSSIGRDRWEQTVTVTYLGGKWLVAGVAYMARDTLDPKHAGKCDINFLTGHGTRNGKPLSGSLKKTIPLAKWSDDLRPTACAF